MDPKLCHCPRCRAQPAPALRSLPPALPAAASTITAAAEPFAGQGGENAAPLSQAQGKERLRDNGATEPPWTHHPSFLVPFFMALETRSVGRAACIWPSDGSLYLLARQAARCFGEGRNATRCCSADCCEHAARLTTQARQSHECH